jgi:hypothetical protein
MGTETDVCISSIIKKYNKNYLRFLARSTIDYANMYNKDTETFG